VRARSRLLALATPVFVACGRILTASDETALHDAGPDAAFEKIADGADATDADGVGDADGDGGCKSPGERADAPADCCFAKLKLCNVSDNSTCCK
jgi:hypothetical protein